MLNFFINILVSLEETSTFCRYDAILFENSIFTVFPEVALFFLSLIGLIFSITFFEKVKLVKEENTSLPLSEKAIGIELEKKLHKENEKIISSTEEGDKTKRLEEVMSFNQYWKMRLVKFYRTDDLEVLPQRFYLDFLIFCYMLTIFMYLDTNAFLPYSFWVCLLKNNIFNNKALVLIKIFLTFLGLFLLILIRFSGLNKKNINQAFLIKTNYFSPETLFIITVNMSISLILISSFNYFSLILFIQALSITHYILFAKVDTKKALNSSLRYYAFSSLILILFIFSAFLFYFIFQGLNFALFKTSIFEIFFLRGDHLVESVELTPLQSFIIYPILICFFCLLFKLGVAPFHSWIINICEKVPRSIVFLVMVINKLSIFIIFFRLAFFIFSDLSDYWKPFLFFFGLLTILYSSILLIKVEKIKTFVTLLLIQSTGFILIILSCYQYLSGFNDTILWSNIFQYLVLSSLSWLVFFFIWSFSENYLRFFINKKFTLTFLTDFFKLGLVFISFEPAMLLILTLILLNIVGFPPFIIFFVKYTIFLLVLNNYGYLALFSLIVFSLIPIYKVFEFLRILWWFYFSDSLKKERLLTSFSGDYLKNLLSNFDGINSLEKEINFDKVNSNKFYFELYNICFFYFRNFRAVFLDFIFTNFFNDLKIKNNLSFFLKTREVERIEFSLKFMFKINKLIIFFLSVMLILIIFNPALFREFSLNFAEMFSYAT